MNKTLTNNALSPNSGKIQYENHQRPVNLKSRESLIFRIYGSLQLHKEGASILVWTCKVGVIRFQHTISQSSHLPLMAEMAHLQEVKSYV